MIEPSGIPSPPLNIQLQVTLEDGRLLAFQTSIEQAAHPSFINEQLDKLNNAADRLKIRYSLTQMEAEMLKERDLLKKVHADFIAIGEMEAIQREQWSNSGRRGEWKRKPNEEQAYAQARMNVQRMEDRVKSLELMYETAKAKAA